MKKYTIKIIIFTACFMVNTSVWAAMTIPHSDSPSAKIYSQRCSSCHSLPHPARLDWNHWRSMLRVMKMRMDEKNMTLTNNEWKQIAHYLKVHARQPLKILLNHLGVQQPHSNKLAPDFTLPILDGKYISLSQLRGTLVLLHFWATWCIPCQHEMPVLYALEKTLNNKNIQIVCVNVDRGNQDGVRSFMQQTTPGFHTLLDADGRIRNMYAIRGLPTTYLIAPDGKIIGRMLGERTWEDPDMHEMLLRLSLLPPCLKKIF